MGYESYVRQVESRLTDLRKALGESVFKQACDQANDRLRAEIEMAQRLWAKSSTGHPASDAPSPPSTDDLVAALQAVEADPGADPTQVEFKRYNTAIQLMRGRHPHVAIPVLDRSVAYEQNRGPSRELAASLFLRAQALVATGETDRALADLDQAADLANTASDSQLAEAINTVRRQIP